MYAEELQDSRLKVNQFCGPYGFVLTRNTFCAGFQDRVKIHTGHTVAENGSKEFSKEIYFILKILDFLKL